MNFSKLKSTLVLLVFITILQSCKDDCDQLCFTPPNNFQFEIVDKISGENLFTNGTYEADQIEVTNAFDDSPSAFTFISENDRNLILINSVGWQTETVSLKIAIANTPIFNLYVDAERKMGKCCSYTDYKEITISGSEFTLDPQTGIYKILVE